jgi:hypothetical protein
MFGKWLTRIGTDLVGLRMQHNSQHPVPVDVWWVSLGGDVIPRMPNWAAADYREHIRRLPMASFEALELVLPTAVNALVADDSGVRRQQNALNWLNATNGYESASSTRLQCGVVLPTRKPRRFS